MVTVQAAKLFFKKMLTFSVKGDRESHHASDTDDCTNMLCAKLKTSILFLMFRNLLEYQTESDM